MANERTGKFRTISGIHRLPEMPKWDDPALAADGARAMELAAAFFRALKVVKIYESARRTAARPSMEGLGKSLATALEARDPVELAVRNDKLLFANQAVYAAEPGISDDLLRALFTAGVRAFRFRRGVAPAELAAFLEELATTRPGFLLDDIAGRLADLEVSHIEFDIVDELAQVDEGRSHVPSSVVQAYEEAEWKLALAAGNQLVARMDPNPTKPTELLVLPDLRLLEGAAQMVGPQVPTGDEGLDATVVRAGEIVVDALIRGTPFPALDAAHALSAVLLEHVRSHDNRSLMELLATIRSLAAGGDAAHAAGEEGPRGAAPDGQSSKVNAAARAAAEATLAMLVPGGFLEPVLYEVFRNSEIKAAEFEELLQRIASHAPEALARLWLVIEAPDRQARVRQRLFEAATENVACLEPLTSGEFGADAARLAVDLLVEAKGPEKADAALKKLVDDPGTADAARVRALVRLEGDREIKALLTKIRNPTRPTRESALVELEKNGGGIDVAREGLEAFMQERQFWGFDQDEMDAVTRAFANIADLRSVRVLDNLAEGSRKITLRFVLGGGSVPDAAKKALAYLKEKRSKGRPAVADEIREAFDDFARRLLRRVVKRPVSLPTGPAAPFVRGDQDMAEAAFAGNTGPVNEAHARIFDSLARALRLVRAFDTSNAVFDEPIAALAETVQKLTETEREVELRIDEGTVFLNRSPLRLDRSAHMRALELQADLAACGMGGLLFKQALTPNDVRGFVGAVAAALTAKAPDAVFAALGAGLARARLDFSVRPLSLAYIAETSLVGKAEASGGVLAKRTYGRILGILTLLYDRYEEQDLRHFLVRRLRRAVQNVASLFEKEPDRVLALHTLRASGDALIDHAVGTTIVALALGRAQGLPRQRLADLGVAAALHAIAHRTRTGDRAVHADMMKGLDDATLRRAPYQTVAELLMERSLEPLFATTLVSGYEHTIPDGYPDANEDLPPLLASRTVAVAHRYHLYSLRRTPRQALDIILESATHDPRVSLHLAKLLGPVPPGTVVVLQDGRVALVARAGEKLPNRPRVRVLENGASTVIDLTDGPGIGRVLDKQASANDLAPFLFS